MNILRPMVPDDGQSIEPISRAMVERHKVGDTFARVFRTFAASGEQDSVQESDVLETCFSRGGHVERVQSTPRHAINA